MAQEPLRDPREPTHPILVRLLSVLLGVCLALLLFAGLYEGLGWLRGAATQPAAAPPPVPDLEPALGGAYAHAPWFHRFEHGPRGMRGRLQPFGFTRDRPGRQNSHGFRVPEYTVARPPDTFRIVIVGDSFTWGDGVRMEETYHRRLQAHLDRRRRTGGPRVEVIGLGMNGSSLLDNLIRLRAHGESLAPDLVLVQYVFNDLEYRARPALLGEDDPEGYLTFLLEQTAAGRALRGRVRGRRLGALVEAEEERTYQRDSFEWRLFVAALEDLAGWRDERDLPVAFVSLPAVDVRPRGGNFDGFRSPPRVYELQSRAEREMQALGFPVARVLDTFRARAGTRYLAVAPDDGHFNPLGHELTAEAVLAFLDGLDDVDFSRPQPSSAAAVFAAEKALRDEAAVDWAALHQSLPRQRDFFERLAALRPGDPWILYDLAYRVQRTGEADTARELFLRAAAAAPDLLAPWYDLSRPVPVAERAPLLERMLESVPDHQPSLEGLAELDAAEGRIARLCGCLQRLAELATHAATYRRAVDGLREQGCAPRTDTSCPGPDPLAEADGHPAEASAGARP